MLRSRYYNTQKLRRLNTPSPEPQREPMYFDLVVDICGETSDDKTKTITLNVKTSDTIDTLKTKIQMHEGIPEMLQTLDVRGKGWLIAGHTLEQYGLSSETRVLCVWSGL